MARRSSNYLTERRRRVQSVSLQELFGLIDQDAVTGEKHHATLLAVSNLDHSAVEMCSGLARDGVEEGRPSVAKQVFSFLAAASPDRCQQQHEASGADIAPNSLS